MTSQDNDNNRSTMLSIRLDPAEQAALRNEAARRGETVSQYVRDAALRRVKPPRAVDVNTLANPITAVVGSPALVLEDGHLLPSSTTPFFRFVKS